ncbi:MAG: imidazole glycerol phosphate synthase subunit HisH [Bacteroidales bacterium]|jgi:imidazole glycerol-phosphate synthase subunit HisH|nr:imidazole glycerol phosphate synthase subunit HisH [Bacteroidales bacterium]
MIRIINYGLGNIDAFINIYKRLNIDVAIASVADDLNDADKLILPGVGAFDAAMICLNNSGMRKRLDYLVKERHIPIVGICVGMQIMANKSEEGTLDGLGWIDAEVKKFSKIDACEGLQIPHMGWNSVECNNDPIFSFLPSNPRFYFLHSFYFSCFCKDNVIATSTYGLEFTSAARNGNIYGLQFHPEKSHGNGIQILKNFANI